MILLVIFLTLLSGLLLFVMSNSTYVTQQFFAQIAPQYKLHYKKIEGNLYTGVTLEEVRFEDAPLAKKITLKYNPNALLYKELQITRLQIKDANVDTIKAFIATFQNDTRNKKEEATEDIPRIGLSIKARDIELSTLPFVEHGIAVDKAVIKAESLGFDLDAYRSIKADGVEGEIVSNLGKIIVSGALHNRVLKLKDLSLLDIDSETIRKLLQKDHIGSQKKVQSQSDTEVLAPPFDEVLIAHGRATLKPTDYHEIAIRQMALDAKRLDILLKAPVLAKLGTLSLDLSTDIAEGNYQGRITDNVLIGKVLLKPHNALYKKYALPLRSNAIERITADINASQERITALITTRAKQLLKVKQGELNLDIDRLHSKLIYELSSGVLRAESEARVDTPYAKAIHIDNALYYDGNLSYSGELIAKNIEQIDPRLRSLLEALHLRYKGTSKSLHTRLESKYLKGRLDSDDLLHGTLHLENKKAIKVSSLISLPAELNSSVIHHLQVDAPVNFKAPMQTAPHILLNSDLIHADLSGSYDKDMKLQWILTVPKRALLRAYQPRIRWENLSPLKIDGTLDAKRVLLNIGSKVLKGSVRYGLKQGGVDAKADINGLKLTAKGKLQEKVTISTKISSIKAFDHTIQGLYRLDTALPPIEGSISIDAAITRMKDAVLTLKSPKLLYVPKRGKKQRIDDIALQMSLKDSELTIPSYRLTYNKQKFFATKPSRVLFKETQITLPAFWVNDTLKVSGAYDLKKQAGAVVAKADRFHIKDAVADIYTKINIEALFKGIDTTVKGKITLLGGSVSPDVQGKSFATDSDIIILQEMKKQNQSSFMEHLSVMLQVDAQVPIVFKQPDTYVRLKPDLTILKEPGGKLLYLGQVELLEGGYYRFQDKKFVLKKSYVYFTGDVNKPLLDIKATYQSLKYLITITVTGTPAAPNINFSSSPSLTREQILSVILFDSEEGGDTHSGDEMMRMMGGAMAKAALSDLGVKVDHLVFGENGSIEVGKKLTKKITVIYINGDEPQIKLKYKHGKHTESVIGVSQKSESYDIIYKGDF